MIEELENLIHILKDAGVHVVCCGGAARDYIHGKAPKDFDLVVLDSSPLVSAPVETWGEFLRSPYVSGVQTFQGEGSEGHSPGDDRLKWVVKFHYKGLGDVDLIRFNFVCRDVVDVVETFDYSLNQAWFEIMQFGPMQIRTVTEYPSVSRNVPNAAVNPSHPERILKLKQAYPEYIHQSTYY